MFNIFTEIPPLNLTHVCVGTRLCGTERRIAGSAVATYTDNSDKYGNKAYYGKDKWPMLKSIWPLPSVAIHFLLTFFSSK